MVEINKKPFLWYLLDKLSSPPNNIKKFLLLTGYLQETITNYFKDGKDSVGKFHILQDHLIGKREKEYGSK